MNLKPIFIIQILISLNLSAGEQSQAAQSAGWEWLLWIYVAVIIYTIFQGVGENRKIVIFRDYNDLGLTFLIPVSAYLLLMIFASLGFNQTFANWTTAIVELILFGILVRNSYEDNHGSLLYTALATVTKLPLAIIWLLSFLTLINPGGKTLTQRRNNRMMALLILAVLTPIINMLVVNKEGSRFNPKEWIRGRGIGTVGRHP